MTRWLPVLLFAGLAVILTSAAASAGPPYLTDDPEPVEYRHWEVYYASQISHDPGLWSGTAPHIEVNYGILHDTQIHLIAPMAFSAPDNGPTTYGYGDTEVGVKYRFLQESSKIPMVGIFPLVEVPTGDHDRGLGSGHVQVFFPVWLQKSFGPWTTYGGGGYWINPGAGNRDWWFFGWLLQRQVLKNLNVGAEIFHETAMQKDGKSDTGFNAGLVFDFSDSQHLLFSGGSRFRGHGEAQFYIAYQLTFGPSF